MKRCANVVSSCWREFAEDSFHIVLSGRHYCSETCALEHNEALYGTSEPCELTLMPTLGEEGRKRWLSRIM